MFDMDNLFDMREIVGTKLEDLLLKRGLTKAKLCADAAISRPTLDKLLLGRITSKANFIHHMEKVLHCLSISPDLLMGNVQNPYARAKSIRQALRINVEEICEATGISAERLREIESGSDATPAELRDIAAYLETGMNNILGNGIFDSQVATLDDLLQKPDDKGKFSASGFWGHIGILPAHAMEYLWYPITAATRSLVYRMQSADRLIVPCMNNKLLYLNTRNVNSLVLLDDACDQPDFANWDSNVDCGDIPQVVYESLEDYFYRERDDSTTDQDKFSPRFLRLMEEITKKMGWDEDTIGEIVSTVSIHYTNGNVIHTDIEFDRHETLSSEVETTYNFEAYMDSDRFIVYSDLNGAEIMVNTDNVSLIELPLAKTEEAILRSYAERQDD